MARIHEVCWLTYMLIGQKACLDALDVAQALLSHLSAQLGLHGWRYADRHHPPADRSCRQGKSSRGGSQIDKTTLRTQAQLREPRNFRRPIDAGLAVIAGNVDAIEVFRARMGQFIEVPVRILR